MFRKSILFALFVVLALALAACAEPETIVETVIVTEVVEIEGEDIIAGSPCDCGSPRR